MKIFEVTTTDGKIIDVEADGFAMFGMYVGFSRGSDVVEMFLNPKRIHLKATLMELAEPEVEPQTAAPPAPAFVQQAKAEGYTQYEADWYSSWIKRAPPKK